MDNLVIVTMLAVLGAALGSFAGAQVWRLRARQLIQDQADGEVVDARELARLRPLKRDVHHDRSECLGCHHQLAWYDLLPIISWLLLQGKCRYCKHPIGRFELLMELGVAIGFVVSYLCWPLPLHSIMQWVLFIIWLVMLVVMAILFAYDTKWYLLPFSMNATLIGLSIMFIVLRTVLEPASFHLWSLVGAIGILAGLYMLFSLFQWVGLGDGILGIALALILGRWELAFLALFLANLLGCLMLVPMAWQRKLHRQAHIPFGPFLIIGMVVAFLWGDALIAAFLGFSGVSSMTLML